MTDQTRSPAAPIRPVVCIQGLGFVGAAMATATASAVGTDGAPAFTVVGLDLPTPEGRRRIDAINAGAFPFSTTDEAMVHAIQQAHQIGNLRASADPAIYAAADVVIVDIHLDVDVAEGRTDFSGLKAAIRTLGERMRPGALVIVETTVPPGTCARIVAPELAAALRERGLPEDAILLAHSYERVMPGPEYFASIVNFWRVYAGHTEAAAEACRAFLERVVDVRRFPLTRLSDTTASETAKVLENTYRAVTIALMDEWGRFAEKAGVDLFEVIDAIRIRPTHSNIRTPGLGVGGYCLTKDPLFGEVSMQQVLMQGAGQFPLSRLAVTINQGMPLHAVDRLREALGGLSGRNILVMGVAYRSDVDDTRYSPSEAFVRKVMAEGGAVVSHDPYVRYWPELEQRPLQDLPVLRDFDAVVLAVAHHNYGSLDFATLLAGSKVVVVDANGVLHSAQRQALLRAGVRVAAVGRGER